MLKYLTLALNEALQDEYKARATYRAIIQRYGPVRPFVNIVEARSGTSRPCCPCLLDMAFPYQQTNGPLG